MAQTERIAVLADIHGNLTALKAVLADAATEGATRYWFLGDLLLPGPGVADLIATLEAVTPAVWLTGNWEQAAFAMMDGRFPLSDPGAIYLARLAMYADAHLTAAQWAWLRHNPLTAQEVVNGLTFALAHNDGEKASGRALYPWMAQANFDAAVPQAADVYVYGHTHQQMMRSTSSGQLIINTGAAGQPYSPRQRLFDDQRGAYALLTVTTNGKLSVDFRRVAYDRQAEIALAVERHMPYLAQYRYLRETGQTVTHDLPLLARVNAENGYVAEVQAALKPNDPLPKTGGMPAPSAHVGDAPGDVQGETIDDQG